MRRRRKKAKNDRRALPYINAGGRAVLRSVREKFTQFLREHRRIIMEFRRIIDDIDLVYQRFVRFNRKDWK